MVHVLGGVAGWGHPASPQGETSMIVRLVYADGTTEDHPLLNGEHVRLELPVGRDIVGGERFDGCHRHRGRAVLREAHELHSLQLLLDLTRRW